MTRHQPDRVSELKELYQRMDGRVRVALCRNHSKISLVRCGDRHFTVTGSGNYSFDTKIEQYELFAGKDMYAWTMATLEEMCFDSRLDDRHTVWE